MVITLNRPDKLNAYTGAMGSEMEGTRSSAPTPTTRCGPSSSPARAARSAPAPTFPAAPTASTRRASTAPACSAAPSGRRRRGFVECDLLLPQASIAAINGPAVGVGITMTLPMDIRIAAKGAKIGFIFARRGLVPEAGSAWFLPKLVGLPQALRWCLSGRIFEAEEALRGGLVSEVTEPDDLLARAKEIALEMTAETSPVSIALTRQMLWRFSGAPDPFEPARDRPADVHRARRSRRRARGRAGVPRKACAGISRARCRRDMPSQYPWWTED